MYCDAQTGFGYVRCSETTQRAYCPGICVTCVVMYNVQVFHHIRHQAMVKRSIFQSGPNQCLQQVLVDNGYTRNDVVIAHVESRALRVGGSQLVEDGVNRQRRSEQTSGNQIMASERAYSALITTRVLGNVHRYEEALAFLLHTCMHGYSCKYMCVYVCI